MILTSTHIVGVNIHLQLQSVCWLTADPEDWVQSVGSSLKLLHSFLYSSPYSKEFVITPESLLSSCECSLRGLTTDAWIHYQFSCFPLEKRRDSIFLFECIYQSCLTSAQGVDRHDGVVSSWFWQTQIVLILNIKMFTPLCATSTFMLYYSARLFHLLVLWGH